MFTPPTGGHLPIDRRDELSAFVFDNVNDAIFVHDLPGHFLDANRVACERYGYSHDEWLQMRVQQLDTVEAAARYDAAVQELLDKRSLVFESVHRRRDGTLVPVEVSARVIEYHGQPAILSVARDISKRRRAEQAQRQAEAKFRNIFENSVEGIFQSTPEGRYLTVNPAMAHIYGYGSPAEMIAAIGDGIAQRVYVDANVRAEFMREMEEFGIVKNFEAANYCRDGNIIWTRTSARAVSDADGVLLYYEGFVEDISERKDAFQALQASEREIQERNRELEELSRQLQTVLAAQQEWNADLERRVQTKTAELFELAESRDRLLRQIITAQEEERRRVARELHDETSQALTALIANLGAAQALPPDQSRARLNELRNSTVEILRGINRIVLDLRPTLLDDYGLIPALSWYADKRFSGSGTRVEVLPGEEDLRLPPTVETILFRVGQEALTNVAKHARAHHVRVSLHRDPSGEVVTLAIEDDGLGFDTEQAQHPLTDTDDRLHLGLLDMRERVQLVGGQLRVVSEPDKGTLIAVTVPAKTGVD